MFGLRSALLSSFAIKRCTAGPGPFGPFNGTLWKTADGREIASLPQGTLPGTVRDPSTEQGGQDHSTFLLAMPSGEMLMAWFSGQMEAEDPMHIAMSRLPAGATQWEPTVVVNLTVEAGWSNQNPVLMHDPQTNLLHLLHPHQYIGLGQGNSTVVMLTSEDDGRTWSKPVPVFTGKGAFVRGAALPGLDGSILLPMYFTPDGYKPETKSDYGALQRSQTKRLVSDPLVWEETLFPNSSGLAQPSTVRLPSGELRTFFRDRFCDSIHVAASKDDGRTWTPATKTVLPNNNAGVWATALKSGGIAVVFNNAHLGRTPLTVALSYDGGETFPFMRDLENEPLPLDQNCTCGRGWSPAGPPVDFYHKNCQPTFAYPTITQTQADEMIHVSYDHNRQVAMYQRFSESWIRGGVESAGIAQPTGDASVV